MKRFFKWSGITIGVLLGFLLVSFLIIRSTGKRAWERELVKWKEIGGVTRLVDLAPEPISGDVNAAMIYQAAIDILEHGNNGIKYDELSELVDPWHVDNDLDAFVDEHSELLVLIHEAVDRPSCVWPAVISGDVSAVAGMNSMHARYLNTMGHFLCAESVFYAQQGDFVKVNETIEAGLRISQHMISEIHMSSALRSIRLEDRILNTFKEIYKDRDYGDISAVQSILGMLDKNKRALLLIPTLISEAAYGIEMVYTNIEDAQYYSDIYADFPFLIKHDAAQYLIMMRKVVDVIALPYAEQDHTKVFPAPPSWAALANLLAIGLNRFNEIITESMIKTVLARQAILLRQYKYENGYYPNPGGTFELMNDPFDGKPFDYELSGEGFILKSRADFGNGNSNSDFVWQWDM